MARLTESQLRNIIKEELMKEMDMTTLATGVAGGVLGTGLLVGVTILGFKVIQMIQRGKESVENIKSLYEAAKRQQAINDKIADQAMKVADLVEKHKDNEELKQLAQSGKLKEFAEMLEQLEGQKYIGKGTGGTTRFSDTARSVYKGMK